MLRTLGERPGPGAAIVKAIETIVDPAARGDPVSPLKWTSKSLVKISAELKA